MEAIFSLPYSEYQVIEEFTKYFPKNKDYSCFIPVSRTNKGIDFILLNQKNGKSVTFQIKGSRSYYDLGEESDNFWFSNFNDKLEEIKADYYILFGMYSDYKIGLKKGIKTKEAWKHFILCIPFKKMKKILEKVVQKKDNSKPDKFFSLILDKEYQINMGRGNSGEVSDTIGNYLLKNMTSEIENILVSKT